MTLINKEDLLSDLRELRATLEKISAEDQVTKTAIAMADDAYSFAIKLVEAYPPGGLP